MAVLKSFIDNPIDVDRFTFHNGVYLAELGELVRYDIKRQIYDDATDVGIPLRSPGSNVILKFYLQNDLSNLKRDIQIMIYYPCADDLRRYPSCAKLSIIIYK